MKVLTSMSALKIQRVNITTILRNSHSIILITMNATNVRTLILVVTDNAVQEVQGKLFNNKMKKRKVEMFQIMSL